MGKQIMKIGEANSYMIAQFSSNTAVNKKCIQFLNMQEKALSFDFHQQDRREKYFSTANINFYKNHQNQGIRINVRDGKLKTKNKEEKIEFLSHPLRDMMQMTELSIKAKNWILKSRIRESIDKTEQGYSSYKYTRNLNEDFFRIKDPFEDSLLKYKEVMFVIKDNIMYFAPNGGNNIQLSHPSLLGKYPYQVDEAGTLIVRNDKIVATYNSGHYQTKTSNAENRELTQKLNPVGSDSQSPVSSE